MRACRLAIAVLAASALILIAPVTAGAHIIVDHAIPNNDGTTTLVFSFDHGCGQAPTTEIEMTLPVGIDAHSTEQPDGWTAEIDSHTVHWTGTPIATDTKTELSITGTINGSAGESLAFPTVQRCENGDFHDWIEPQGGDYPAPVLVATAAMLAPPNTSGGAGVSSRQVIVAIAAFVAAAAALGATTARRVSSEST